MFWRGTVAHSRADSTADGDAHCDRDCSADRFSHPDCHLDGDANARSHRYARGDSDTEGSFALCHALGG